RWSRRRFRSETIGTGSAAAGSARPFWSWQCSSARRGTSAASLSTGTISSRPRNRWPTHAPQRTPQGRRSSGAETDFRGCQHLLQRESKNEQRVSGGDGDLLSAVHRERHGIGMNVPARLELPETPARLRVESEEVAFRRAAKDQATSSGQQACPG